MGSHRVLEVALAVFVSILVAPLVLLGAAVTFDSPVPSLGVLLIAVLITALLAGAVVRQIDALEERLLAGTNTVSVLLFLMMFYAVLIGPLGARESVQGPMDNWAVMGWIAAMGGGGVLWYARRRRKRATLEAATTYASWDAVGARRTLRRVVAGVVVLLPVTLVGVLAALSDGFSPSRLLWLFLGVLVFELVFLLAGRNYLRPPTVQVTDCGLLVEPVLHSWEMFESYRFEENSLVLVLSDEQSAQRYDRTQIADEAAVRTALNRVLEAQPSS